MILFCNPLKQLAVVLCRLAWSPGEAGRGLEADGLASIGRRRLEVGIARALSVASVRRPVAWRGEISLLSSGALLLWTMQGREMQEREMCEMMARGCAVVSLVLSTMQARSAVDPRAQSQAMFLCVVGGERAGVEQVRARGLWVTTARGRRPAASFGEYLGWVFSEVLCLYRELTLAFGGPADGYEEQRVGEAWDLVLPALLGALEVPWCFRRLLVEGGRDLCAYVAAPSGDAARLRCALHGRLPSRLAAHCESFVAAAAPQAMDVLHRLGDLYLDCPPSALGGLRFLSGAGRSSCDIVGGHYFDCRDDVFWTVSPFPEGGLVDAYDSEDDAEDFPLSPLVAWRDSYLDCDWPNHCKPAATREGTEGESAKRASRANFKAAVARRKAFKCGALRKEPPDRRSLAGS